MLLIGESVARIAIAEIQILVGHNSDNSLADGDIDDPAMFDTIQRHAFELTVIGFAFPRQRRNRIDQHRHQIHVAAALVADDHVGAGGLPLVAEFQGGQPATIKVAALVGSCIVDAASLPFDSMTAPLPHRLVQLGDAYKFAAERARSAGAFAIGR